MIAWFPFHGCHATSVSVLATSSDNYPTSLAEHKDCKQATEERNTMKCCWCQQGLDAQVVQQLVPVTKWDVRKQSHNALLHLACAMLPAAGTLGLSWPGSVPRSLPRSMRAAEAVATTPLQLDELTPRACCQAVAQPAPQRVTAPPDERYLGEIRWRMNATRRLTQAQTWMGVAATPPQGG